MKKISTKVVSSLTLLAVLLLSGNLYAQEVSGAEDGKNMVKWNVGALLLKNYSFQYERAISNKISVAASIRFSPKSNIAFKSSLKDVIDNDDTWNNIKDFKTGNFAFAPEVRFYLGKGVFRGFYLAPFAQYARYSGDVPFTFDVDVAGTTKTETMPLSGDVTALTAGLMIGAQHKLSKQIYLNWFIGPNYGTSSGKIDGKKTLNSDEQDALRDALTDLDDLPLVKTKYTVDGNGAKVDFDGPWAGLRAGLSIGFRF